MSGSSWLYHIAVRGWLIAVILLSPIPLSAQDAPADQKTTGQESSDKPTVAEETPPAAALEDQRPAEPPCGERCQAAEERDKADLKAQQSMSDSAFWMNWASWGQVGIGMLGLILLGFTARYAYRAAVAAERTIVEARAATNAARRGASAAYDAVTQARAGTAATIKSMDDTAERQLRAYVYFEDAKRIKEGDIFTSSEKAGWRAHATFKNYGQTPAYETKIAVQASVDVSDFDETLLDIESMVMSNPAFYLPPGETADIEIPLPMLDGDWTEFKDRKVTIFLWGRIEYLDAFKAQRWSTFRMKNHFGHGSGFAYCETGNNAN